MTINQAKGLMTLEELKLFEENIIRSDVLRELPYETGFSGSIQNPKQFSCVSITSITNKIDSLMRVNEAIVDKYDPKRK